MALIAAHLKCIMTHSGGDTDSVALGILLVLVPLLQPPTPPGRDLHPWYLLRVRDKCPELGIINTSLTGQLTC